MRFVVALLVMAALLLVGAGAVRAQVDSREGIALQNEIYQLRQELKTLQDQTARGGGGGSRQAPSTPPTQAGGSELVAQLLTRVDALQEQVRQLRGRIDETQNQVQRQNDELSKRIDDLAFQINPQGGRQGGGPGALLPPSAGQGLALAQVPPPPPPRPAAAAGAAAARAGFAGRERCPRPSRLSGGRGRGARGVGESHLAACL